MWYIISYDYHVHESLHYLINICFGIEVFYFSWLIRVDHCYGCILYVDADEREHYHILDIIFIRYTMTVTLDIMFLSLHILV